MKRRPRSKTHSTNSKKIAALGFGSRARALIKLGGGGIDLELPKRSLPRKPAVFGEESQPYQ